MNKRQIAIAVIGMVGVLVASDFVANIRTFASPTILAEITEELGVISFEQHFIRIALLAVITFISAALCFAATWGFYRNLVLKVAYRWAAGALIITALFHLGTALIMPVNYIWFLAAAYAVVGVTVFTVGRWASS
jgi:hypothetical protein